MKKYSGQTLVKFVFIGCFLALLCACGYSFAPMGEYIDKGVQKIYVEQFANKTAQAEVENYLRSAFIDQFLQTDRFKIVDNAEEADATIKGSLLNLTTAPLSYRANSLVAEERATMTLELAFRERESGKTIWSSPGISGSVDYRIEDNINLLPTTRRAALIKLAADTAEKIFNQMMSGF